MIMVRCFIVEDNIAYIKALSILIKKYTFLELLGSATNIHDAVEDINRLNPDLLFMDIRLGNASGFDVLDHCNKSYRYVIFTTAYADFALKTYSYNTIHYLLKPYKEEQLEEAIQKFLFLIKVDNDMKIDATPNLYPYDNRLFIPERNIYYPIKFENIMYLEADSNYTNIYLTDVKYKLSKTLKIVLTQCENYPNIMRIHKKYAVNISFIQTIKRGVDSELILINGTSLPISKNEKEAIFIKLGIK